VHKCDDLIRKILNPKLAFRS